MGDAQDIEMDGSSEYDEENSSQISSNLTNHTSKKQQNEDNRHGKTTENFNQNGINGGKKKNRALLLAQQNSATDRLSDRDLKKIRQQIDRLEHQPEKNKKKKQMSEKKIVQSDSSLEETSKKEQQPQANSTLLSSSNSTSQVKVKQEATDTNESNNSKKQPITLTKERSQQSTQKSVNNMSFSEQQNPKQSTFQTNNPKQNHNPFGIIITEDDSEVSASCDQLDEVEKPLPSYNSKNNKNIVNNNTSSNNEIVNLNKSGGKMSPTDQLNTASAAEPVIRKKRKYERRNKEENNISKQGSQDSPVSSIQVISTTNEVKSNTKIPSRSGSATLIAPIHSVNGTNSSEAVVSLIPRKLTIPSENQIPFTSTSNIQHVPSYQANEAPRVDQASSGNGSQLQFQKNYSEQAAFSSNGVANSLLPSSTAKQLSEESQFQKTGLLVSGFAAQNKNLSINGDKNDLIQTPNTNLMQGQSISLNEQIPTLSSENNIILQKQSQKRQKISKEEKSLSSSVVDSNFSTHQSQKANLLHNSDEIQTNSHDIVQSVSQKQAYLSGKNGDSGQLITEQGEQNTIFDNNNPSNGMTKPSRKNDLIIKSKIKRGPLQGGAYEDQPDLFLSLSSYQDKLQRAREDMTAKFFGEYIEDQNQKQIIEQAQQGLFTPMASVLQKQKTKSYLCPKPIFSPKGNKIFLTFKPQEMQQQQQQGSYSGSQESISSEISINQAQELQKSRVRKAETTFLLDQTSLLQETIVKKFKAQNFQEATKDPFSPLLNDFAASYLDPSYCQKVLSGFKRQQEFNESLENQELDIDY